MRLLAALCLLDTVSPWAPHAAQRWARHSARSANPQDVETARSADIVAVAESFGIDVNSRNKACCPFHDERTPSFTLNPDKGLYKCFGCGAGGDVIKLYRELANATFSEAVEALVKEDRPRVERVAEAPEVDASERITLKQANAVAQEIYAEALRHQTSGGARQYLRKRGINARTAAAFGLGFARPGTARSLTKDMEKSAFVAAGSPLPTALQVQLVDLAGEIARAERLISIALAPPPADPGGEAGGDASQAAAVHPIGSVVSGAGGNASFASAIDTAGTHVLVASAPHVTAATSRTLLVLPAPARVPCDPPTCQWASGARSGEGRLSSACRRAAGNGLACCGQWAAGRSRLLPWG